MQQAYHCICSTPILVTNYSLDELPTRQGPDQAKILVLRNEQIDVIMQNVQTDNGEIVVRKENGFEKRILLRCAHCEVTIGYHLDQAHFTNAEVDARKIVYVLPGSLMLTETMLDGRRPPVPVWAQSSK